MSEKKTQKIDIASVISGAFAHREKSLDVDQLADVLALSKDQLLSVVKDDKANVSEVMLAWGVALWGRGQAQKEVLKLREDGEDSTLPDKEFMAVGGFEEWSDEQKDLLVQATNDLVPHLRLLTLGGVDKLILLGLLSDSELVDFASYQALEDLEPNEAEELVAKFRFDPSHTARVHQVDDMFSFWRGDWEGVKGFKEAFPQIDVTVEGDAQFALRPDKKCRRMYIERTAASDEDEVPSASLTLSYALPLVVEERSVLHFVARVNACKDPSRTSRIVVFAGGIEAQNDTAASKMHVRGESVGTQGVNVTSNPPHATRCFEVRMRLSQCGTSVVTRSMLSGARWKDENWNPEFTLPPGNVGLRFETVGPCSFTVHNIRISVERLDEDD